MIFWLLTSNQPCSQLNRYKLVTPWVFSYLWHFRTRAASLSFPVVVSPGHQRAAKTLGGPARWWEHRAETTVPLQEISFKISTFACQKSVNMKAHPPPLPACVTPVPAMHFEGSGWVTVFSRQVGWMGSTGCISQSTMAICTWTNPFGNGQNQSQTAVLKPLYAHSSAAMLCVDSLHRARSNATTSREN